MASQLNELIRPIGRVLNNTKMLDPIVVGKLLYALINRGVTNLLDILNRYIFPLVPVVRIQAA